MRNKINIMKTTPEISDEEIRSYMDFEGLLRKGQDLQVKTRTWTKIAWGLAGTVSVAFVAFLFWSQVTKQAGPIVDHTATVVDSADREVSDDGKLDRVPATTSSPVADELTVDEPYKEMNPSLEIPDESLVAERENAKQKNPLNTLPAVSEAPNTSETSTHTEAVPVNGYHELYEFLNKELTYPKEALADSVQGVMTVSFVVDAHGSIGSITFDNSLGPLFEREAHQLMSNMPAWNPATINGKPVSSRLSLPLTFRIETIKKQLK